MPTTRSLLSTLLAASVLALAACGEDSEEAAPTTEPQAETQAATASGPISEDTSTKPEIPRPEGEPPTELVSDDVVKGDGRTAREGDNVTVQYVGVNFATGEQFDASWDRGEPFTFTLGSGQVIPGWDEGVQGMRVGGRRKLTLPPDLAYGAQGTPDGSIPPNSTLVFVIDLEKIERGQ